MKKLRVFIKSILFVIMISILSGYKLSAQEYIIGADLSFLKMGEDNGYVFKENNQQKEGLEIFREHGYNWIRLRIFHTPVELHHWPCY